MITQQEWKEYLIKLIEENPDAEIKFVVDYDENADCGLYEIMFIERNKYIVAESGYIIIGEDDIADYLCSQIVAEPDDKDTEEEIRKRYEAIPYSILIHTKVVSA